MYLRFLLPWCVLFQGLGFGQEAMPLELARDIARRMTAHAAATTAGLPVAVDPDAEQAQGLRVAKAGALVIPHRGLTPATLAAPGGALVPIALVYLRELTLRLDGAAVATDRLRVVTVGGGERTMRVPALVLAAQRSAGGTHELVVFGRDPESLLRVPMGKVETAARFPVELSGEAHDEQTGTLTLNVVGQWEAELALQKAP